MDVGAREASGAHPADMDRRRISDKAARTLATAELAHQRRAHLVDTVTSDIALQAAAVVGEAERRAAVAEMRATAAESHVCQLERAANSAHQLEHNVGHLCAMRLLIGFDTKAAIQIQSPALAPRPPSFKLISFKFHIQQ